MSDLKAMARVILLSLCLIFRFCEGQQGWNVSELLEKCTKRYDLTVGIAKEELQDENCTLWGINTPIICQTELEIMYYNITPYIYEKPNGIVDGILPALFGLAMKVCCNSCTRIKYLKPKVTYEEFSEVFRNTSYYSMFLPILAVKNEDTLFGLPFVKLLHTPGVYYIQLDEASDKTMDSFLQSIAKTWPLFVTLLLLTAQGGIIIWLLDMRSNSEEFPPEFLRGILEGSWWAYVSMTTVGYGDKAPKSYLGRMFSVFWITVGIAISGMFTASLSSSFTSALIVGKTDLNGHKVGLSNAMSLGYEENIIYREGGEPRAYWNDSKMFEDFKNRKIHGIIMDRFIYRYKSGQLKATGLQLSIKKDIEKSETEIGLLITRSSMNKWAVFLRAFFSTNKDAESRLLVDAMDSMRLKVRIGDQPKSSTTNPFESQTVTNTIIGAFGIVLATLFVAGLILHLIRQFYIRRKCKKIALKAMEMEVHQTSTTLDENLNKDLDALAEEMRKKLLNCFQMHIKQLKREKEGIQHEHKA